MPPFKLEAYIYVPGKERKVERIVFTKGVYDPRVKITDWEKIRESQPIDNDPYCSGNLNFMLSHYKRFGTHPDEKYVTTTREMLEQIHEKNQSNYIDPNKKLINYYTYNDDFDCELKDSQIRVCPKVCAERYVSTMQDDYRAPHFCKIQRLALPVIPYLRNRKFKGEDPRLTPCKFYDEGFHDQTLSLMKHKSEHWISYNPCTGFYSDGTVPGDNGRGCVDLDYNKL